MEKDVRETRDMIVDLAMAIQQESTVRLDARKPQICKQFEDKYPGVGKH